jgi:hypothetical protein
LFEPDEWVAVFLKSYVDGRVVQRVASAVWAASDPVQAWLRAMNAHRFNVYVSVNALRPGSRSRTRAAIAFVRNVFVEADHDGDRVLAAIECRPDLTGPSYILHSSPNRVHIFWRVAGFSADGVERLQKMLARELGTDPAATPVTQNTRLPGFFNYKHAERYMVWIEYRDVERVLGPADFPQALPPAPGPTREWQPRNGSSFVAVERARRYLERIPPAIAGQHGDVHTFRVCCRLARGFALDDHDALDILAGWNERCQPPWSDAELRGKLRAARQYGREPVGGLLQRSAFHQINPPASESL